MSSSTSIGLGSARGDGAEGDGDGSVGVREGDGFSTTGGSRGEGARVVCAPAVSRQHIMLIASAQATLRFMMDSPD